MVLNSTNRATRFTKYEIKDKTTVFENPLYLKYKHGYTFDHLIYLTCICKILVQSK